MAKGKDKGKQEKEKKPAYKYSNVYEVKGESVERKTKSCPKCGTGTFMGKHKDRYSCGKCQYMEKL